MSEIVSIKESIRRVSGQISKLINECNANLSFVDKIAILRSISSIIEEIPFSNEDPDYHIFKDLLKELKRDEYNRKMDAITKILLIPNGVC